MALAMGGVMSECTSPLGASSALPPAPARLRELPAGIATLPVGEPRCGPGGADRRVRADSRRALSGSGAHGRAVDHRRANRRSIRRRRFCAPTSATRVGSRAPRAGMAALRAERTASGYAQSPSSSGAERACARRERLNRLHRVRTLPTFSLAREIFRRAPGLVSPINVVVVEDDKYPKSVRWVASQSAEEFL